MTHDAASAQAGAIADHAHAPHRDLLDWAMGCSTNGMPDPVLSRSARVIADSIACMIAAQYEPEVECFHGKLTSRARTAEATLFRTGAPRVDRQSAALGNALADVWHELEEGWRTVPCHAGLYVLPALLAEAEAAGISVRRTLGCVAVAYEVVTRFAATWSFPDMADQGRGWVHARFNGIGAAVATALVRQLPAPLCAAAVENALSMALIGPRRHHLDGALVWNAWPAAATWIGMTSVDWAECGIAGLATTPIDVMGTEFRGEACWPNLTAGLGRTWAILEGYTKIHACIQHAHSTVEAVLDARPEVLARGGEIQEIRVEAHRLALFLDQPNPLTSLAAKFSLQHIAASTYIHGSAGPEAFSAASLSDPEVTALRRNVCSVPFGEGAGAHDRPARVTFVMTDGTKISKTCLSAAGGPDRPFGDEVVWAKIESLTRTTAPQFIRLARALERLDPDWIDRPWAQFVRAACEA